MTDWIQLYFQIKTLDWILGIVLILGILIWLWFDMRKKHDH